MQLNYENRKPYEPWEDEIVKSLLHVRHSIKLTMKALPHRSRLSIEARRKKLMNPSRQYVYKRERTTKNKTKEAVCLQSI